MLPGTEANQYCLGLVNWTENKEEAEGKMRYSKNKLIDKIYF